MPKESLNIYFSIRDDGSATLTSLADKTKALDKETQSLAQAAEALNQANAPLIQKQTQLKTELEKSSQTVKDARKAYREYGDEVHDAALSSAIQEHEDLRRQLKDTEDQLKANQKSYSEYREEIRKGGLQDGTRPETGTEGSFFAKLATSGVMNQLSNSLSGAAGAYLTSAIGTPEASLVSDVVSGAISGAAAGIIAGPVGAAIGAVIGMASGAIAGGTKIFEAQDDAFKAYYKGIYDQFDATEDISGGSSIAAGRETDLISLTTMFGNDRDAAVGYLPRLVDMSNRTPFLYDDLMAMSKTLATYGYDETDILPVLQTIGDTGAALGQSTSDMNSVATAIGRMQSSDKASLEYLNILNDRGINAVGYLAEARGRTVAETYDDISKGNIRGTEAVQIILDAMERSYAGSMEAQSKTFSGLTSTLEGLKQEVDNAAGEGYNALRGEGVQEEISSLGGPLGDAMKEMNALIGENQAYLENLQEQYQRDALNALFYGTKSDLFDDAQQATMDEKHQKYLALKEAADNGDRKSALELQELYEEVQEAAQAYYDSSADRQSQEEAKLEHLAAIREITKDLPSRFYEYLFSKEANKGMAATVSGYTDVLPEYRTGMTEDEITALQAKAAMEKYRSSVGDTQDDGILASSHAFGLGRVPYDNYPALLHRDERVLTASEARAQDAGRAAPVFSISISGNDFVGTGEEMADQIMEIVMRKLERAVTAFGR